MMSFTSTRRSKVNRHSILLKAVIICIALNILVQISLHLHLDKHLSFTPSPFDFTKREFIQSNENKDKSPPRIVHSSDTAHFSFSKSQAEKALQTHGRNAVFQPLRAYIERPLNDTVPGSVNTGNLEDKRPKVQVGRPGLWYVPLPLREGGPEDVSLLFCVDIERIYLI
jgi:hypothetical protein